MAATVNTQV